MRDSLCVICMNIITLVPIPLCKHKFCEPCIHKWLDKHDTCPMCRCVVAPTTVPKGSFTERKKRVTYWSNDRSLQRIANLIGV